MARNTDHIPVTEIIERVGTLGKSNVGSMERIRGVTQDVYCREIPAKHDWNFLFVSSSLTSVEEFVTGTGSVNTGNSNVTFVGAIITSDMLGRRIWFTGDGAGYDITGFISSSDLTINPPYRGNNNLSGVSFSINQPVYPIAKDFDRFPKNGGIFKWEGGHKQTIPETDRTDWVDNYQTAPSVPARLQIIQNDTAGNTQIEVNPPPKKALNYPYDYLKKLTPLFETTAGTVLSIQANSVVVTGNTNCKFLEAQTGDWFRIDNLGTGQDSLWYRIISIQNNSALTLQTSFANTAITSSANFTIARAPDMPTRMHIAVLYGALRGLTIGDNDKNALFYNAQYAQVMSDCKRIYVSRPYSQKITGAIEEYHYRR